MIKMKGTADILNGPIWKQILIFFFPILLGTLFQQIYNTTDTVIVGNFVGKEALAAVGGSPFYIINIVIGFSVGLSSGFSVIIAQFFGSRKHKHLSDAIHTSMAFSIGVGIFVNIVMLLVSRPLLLALKVPAGAMKFSLDYMNIVSFGFVFTMVYNMCTAIFRAIGDSRRPLYFLMFSCAVNIVLDLAFVVILKLDVRGVAIATVISQFLSALLALRALVRAEGVWRITIKKIRIHPVMLYKMVRVGIPRALQSVQFSVANMLVQSSFNLLGITAVAGWTVDGKVEQVFWMILNCFGVSITVFTAQNLGARKYERVREGLRVTLRMSFFTTAACSVIMLLMGPFFCRFFTSDPGVLAYAVSILRICAPCYLFYIAVEIIAGFLYGLGISFEPMLIMTTGICVFRIFWVIFVINAAPEPTLYRVITVYPTTWALTSLMFILYYRFSRKRKHLMGM
ncbi:MAG: MATE family efflux transporter [Fusobacteriaceae bacterium]|jgi:putative MATE family efflux protein|nr:MATE family efflux transporter [Fusobacteriaceae bacterium]